MSTKTLSNIMLIDDDEATNFVHEWVLRQADVSASIQVYQSAIEGLKILQQEPPKVNHPEIIFLDINMPGMSGWEFLEHYKDLPQERKAQILVVMLTTSLNPDDRERAESISDIHSFMSKPLSEEKVKGLIENHFN